MATNKRKEAAALFELIDKSTLKVPKNAGALKIPSWWSSRSNPSPPTPAGASPSGNDSPVANGQANGTPTAHRTVTPPTTTPPRPIARSTMAPAPSSLPSPISDILSSTLPPSEAAASELSTETGQQHRLFDPPPANAAPPTPAATPSIRPPMPNLPVSPSIKSPPPPPAISPPVAASVPVDTDEPLPEEPAAAPAATRPFAPQTHAQGAPRSTWTPPRGSLARVPIWGFAAGAAVVVILLCLLIAVILSSKGTPQKASASGDNATPANGNPGNSGNRENPGNVQPLIPNQQRPVEPPAPRGNGGNLRPAPVAENTGPGRVYGPKQVTRSPDLYYVLIAQSPDLKIAQRNANLIAENGVDVSMEIMKGGMYALISAQGFRTLEEGEPTRAKIVQIGHLLPEYKRTKRAWDDATLQRFRAPPQPAAAG